MSERPPKINWQAGRPSEVTPWFARFYYTPLFAYFAVNAFFLCVLQTPREAGLAVCSWDVLLLAPFLAVFVAAVAFRHRTWLRLHLGKKKKRKVSVLAIAIIFYLFCVSLGAGTILAINATGGASAPVILSGRILAKRAFVGRYGISSYALFVNENSQHRLMSFWVSRSTYDSAWPGEFYRVPMRVGRLGILYRWTWDRPEPEVVTIAKNSFLRKAVRVDTAPPAATFFLHARIPRCLRQGFSLVDDASPARAEDVSIISLALFTHFALICVHETAPRSRPSCRGFHPVGTC